MDRTLKIHGGLTRTRSVQTRAERIASLIEEGKFDPETDRPYGLPKVKIRHSKAGTKTKKAAEPAAAEAEEVATEAEGGAEAPKTETPEKGEKK